MVCRSYNRKAMEKYRFGGTFQFARKLDDRAPLLLLKRLCVGFMG